jgi:hypothetical protein
VRPVKSIPDSEEDKARARLLAHFVDRPQEVFYSRQLEVLYEKEFFHWLTNRALRRLIDEKVIVTESRKLHIGTTINLVWNKSFRFYRRAATKVFNLVNDYTNAAGDGTLGMQGEHMTLAAFARRQFILRAEEANEWQGKKWLDSNHNLDFIFERNSVAYGVEVKNTLGYLDSNEFVTKIKMARFLGLKPLFVVRDLPRTWISALAKSGGFALIMRYQFYPWTHEALAGRVRDELGLPVDTPKKIEDGTMMRLEQWIANPPTHYLESNPAKVERLLQKINPEYKP